MKDTVRYEIVVVALVHAQRAAIGLCAPVIVQVDQPGHASPRGLWLGVHFQHAMVLIRVAREERPRAIARVRHLMSLLPVCD